jgi:hypothetical protein
VVTTYAMKPQVTIRNNSNREIVLGVSGPETRFITIPARSSGTIALHSGTYKYAAKARNTPVISGYKTFGTDTRYNWNFGIN